MAKEKATATVSGKLAIVQKELKAPKNQYNSFGKYSYRNAEDILESAKPLCVDNGLALTITDDIVFVGDRYYVKATAKITDVDTGDTIEVTAYARESLEKKGMDSAQVTGATSSYARKYALNGLFCIDDTKDVDSEQYQSQTKQASKSVTNVNKSVDKPKASPLASAEEIEALVKEITTAGIDLNKVLTAYHIQSLNNITVDLFNTIWSAVQKKKAQSK